MKVTLKQDVLIFDEKMRHVRLPKGTEGIVTHEQGEILEILIGKKKYKLNRLLVGQVKKDETR